MTEEKQNGPTPKFICCKSTEELGEAVAAAIFEKANQAYKERGVFNVAISGGSLLDVLSKPLLDVRDKPSDARPTDLKNWHVFFVDERCVSKKDKDSNYGEAEKKLPLTSFGEVISIKDELASSKYMVDAAKDYAEQVKAKVQGDPPVFDLVLLGMGPDGHTASLFPNSPQLTAESIVAAAESPNKPPRYRITLTLPVLQAARAAFFVVSTGSKVSDDKRDRVREVRAMSGLPSYYPHSQPSKVDASPLFPASSPSDFPAGLVTGDDVRWYIDEGVCGNHSVAKPEGAPQRL